MAIFNVPQRFSQKWVSEKVPTMDSTEFHAMFYEAAARGWDEAELRDLARMWVEAATPTGDDTHLIKLTIHRAKGVWVVNTPGSYVQRQPRTYHSVEKAMERVGELRRRIGPSAKLIRDER